MRESESFDLKTSSDKTLPCLHRDMWTLKDLYRVKEMDVFVVDSSGARHRLSVVSEVLRALLDVVI